MWQQRNGNKQPKKLNLVKEASFSLVVSTMRWVSVYHWWHWLLFMGKESCSSFSSTAYLASHHKHNGMYLWYIPLLRGWILRMVVPHDVKQGSLEVTLFTAKENASHTKANHYWRWKQIAAYWKFLWSDSDKLWPMSKKINYCLRTWTK